MKYKKGNWKYQLAEDESVEVPWLVGYDIDLDFIKAKDGWLTGKTGYAWDGASRPAINTENLRTPSLFHDILYQLLRMDLLPAYLREKADKLLVSMCKDRGMWWLRRKWIFVGVDKFAGNAASRENRKKIYTVP